MMSKGEEAESNVGWTKRSVSALYQKGGHALLCPPYNLIF